MIDLNLSKTPSWLDLVAGVRVQLRPLSTSLMLAARADAEIQDLSETVSDDARAVIFAKVLGRLAILDWEGVGDHEGVAVAPTAQAIDALLDIWPIFEAFQTQYVAKALLIDAEKNVSAPLPTGSSVGARAIARPARKAAVTAQARSMRR